jgi:lipopolysaccharide/colanic/teichoic acid biosynthesis glycosyltransferase
MIFSSRDFFAQNWINYLLAARIVTCFVGRDRSSGVRNLDVVRAENRLLAFDFFEFRGDHMRRQLVQITLDLLLILLASLVALWLRENFEMPMNRFVPYLPHLALTLAVAVPILMINGVHRSIWRLSERTDYLRISGASLAIVVAATMLGFLVNRLDTVPRSLPVLQALVMVVAMVGARVFAREIHVRRRQTQLTSIGAEAVGARDTVLVVGINSIAELYLHSVAEYGADRVVVAGLLGRNERHSGRIVQQQKILGTPEEVVTILRDLDVHGVFVNRILLTVPFDSLSESAQETLLEVERGSEITLDFFAERVFGTESGPGGKPGGPVSKSAEIKVGNQGLSLKCSETDLEALGRNRYFAVKRGLDILGATALLLLTLPFMALIALFVAIDIGLPTMFWQQRPGRFGVPFRVYKFRTMGAAHGRDGRRIPDIDRSSVIGSFLRRFRLDELPQLWDILRGDMSFVGPRPLLPVDQSPSHSARLLMRPGLTGWAQIKGGREISAEDKAALDIWYVRNASFKLDMQIAALTVPMVFGGERIDTDSILQARRELTALGFYTS